MKPNQNTLWSDMNAASSWHVAPQVNNKSSDYCGHNVRNSTGQGNPPPTPLWVWLTGLMLLPGTATAKNYIPRSLHSVGSER